MHGHRCAALQGEQAITATPYAPVPERSGTGSLGCWPSASLNADGQLRCERGSPHEEDAVTCAA